MLTKLGKSPISMSKKIKNSVKSAVKFINNFETITADIAIENEYDYVICGHIHQPEIKEIANAHGSVMYLNSGDWIENLTALEFNNKKWKLYRHDIHKVAIEEENLEYENKLAEQFISALKN